MASSATASEGWTADRRLGDNAAVRSWVLARAEAIGRRRAAGGALALCALAAGLGVGVALGASGGLDASFGNGGTTVLERPTSTYPTPTALASGGKFVVVSTSIPGGIAVSRRLPNGAPDPTFNGGENAVIEEPGMVPSAYGVALQPDGKIVLVGFRNEGSKGEEEGATVWRLKADGGSGVPNDALDPTFGKKGLAVIKTFTHTVGSAVAIQPDGKIVAAGRGFSATGPNKVAVWRLTAGGELDPSFNATGTAEISDKHEDYVYAIALQPDGKIVLAGASFAPPQDAVVWRLKANGGAGGLNEALDTTFGAIGQANVEVAGGSASANALALQPDGKIVIAGSTGEGPLGYDAMVWRLEANGGTVVTNSALDPSFGNAGAAAIGGAGVFARAAAVELQPDGKILVAGSTRTGENPSAAVIWRLLAGGGTAALSSALDPTFGTGGATTVTSGPFAEVRARAAARPQDHRDGLRARPAPAHVPCPRRPFRSERREGRHGLGLGAVRTAGHRLRSGVLGIVRRRVGSHADGHARPGVGVRRLVGRRMQRG